MFLIVFCQHLSTSSSSVSPVPLWCRADAPLTVCSRDGRGQRERERVKEMCERRRERETALLNSLCLTGLIHWQAAWRGRWSGGNWRGREDGWEGKADTRGERERARRQEKGGGRGDRVQTVACSPTNQNVDEGIWVWLGDCRGDVGQYKCTSSLTRSPYVSAYFLFFLRKYHKCTNKRSQQSFLQW